MIFISSPYSHEKKTVKEHRYKLAVKYTAMLLNRGEIAISPIAYGHAIAEQEKLPTDWAFWNKFCSEILFRCDCMHVLMLDGWDTSEGVQEEMSIAEDHNIKIVFIKPEILI